MKVPAAEEKIGIIAPGTAVTSPDDIAKCIEVMKFFQFEYVHNLPK